MQVTTFLSYPPHPHQHDQVDQIVPPKPYQVCQTVPSSETASVRVTKLEKEAGDKYKTPVKRKNNLNNSLSDLDVKKCRTEPRRRSQVSFSVSERITEPQSASKVEKKVMKVTIKRAESGYVSLRNKTPESAERTARRVLNRRFSLKETTVKGSPRDRTPVNDSRGSALRDRTPVGATRGSGRDRTPVGATRESGKKLRSRNK